MRWKGPPNSGLKLKGAYHANITTCLRFYLNDLGDVSFPSANMAPKQVAKSKAAPNLDSILKNGLMPGGEHGRRIMNFFGVFPPWGERNRDAGSFLPYSKLYFLPFGYATILGHGCHHNAIHREVLPGCEFIEGSQFWGNVRYPIFPISDFFVAWMKNGSFEDMAQLLSNFWVTVFYLVWSISIKLFLYQDVFCCFGKWCCWWFGNPANLLSLVVYPILFSRCINIQGGFLAGFVNHGSSKYGVLQIFT